MNTILVAAAVQDGRLKRSTFEVMARAREVAAETGSEVVAAVLHPTARDLVPDLMRHGAVRVYVVEDPVFDRHVNVPVIDALERVVKAALPRLVVAPSTEAFKDVMGALAVRLGAGALPDVSEFGVDGDSVVAVRPVMAAKMLARVSSREPLVLVSVRSGSYEASASPVEGEIVPVDFSCDAGTLRQTLREVLSSGDGEVDLSEARVVVAAGRGIRDEAGRDLVLELADATGAAIGASRAVVETGLFPATAQIGQTGKVVAPDLYFAVGISGAIQHVAGMVNSRVIVAINKDPDAPIFDYATYGIVGDAFKVLPPLIEALRDAGKT